MNLGFQVLIVAGLLHVQPEIAKARPNAPTFLTVFQCAAYAELMENQAEFRRLLNAGFKTGKAFLESAAIQGTRYSDLFAALPGNATIRLEGPSVEFVLGRLYEAESQKAWDRAMRQDEFGAWLPIAEWRYTTPESSRRVASQRFHDLACASLP